MVKTKRFNLRYIIDENGRKKDVVLPIREFESLLEDLEDLAVAAERRDEETISHKDVILALKKDGILPN